MAYQVRDAGILVHGFTGLQKALQRIEGSKGNYGLDYELKRRLAVIGESVAKAAPQFVSHKTGRRGAEPLEDSVKVSVTTRSASVYSTSKYGGAQNVGAGPKAGWAARGPHIRKDKASAWMIKAVQSERANIERELDGLMDWVVAEFHAGQ